MSIPREANVTRADGDAWFPGRWVGGVSMVAGPLLLLAGVLLRFRFGFFFPAQLEAFGEHPRLVAAAYSAFAAGNVILCFAVAALARAIGGARPVLARWGGALAVLGLFARTFHAGVDHLAFQLVRQHGVAFATRTVAESYGAYHLFRTLSPAIMLGWIVLAIAAYASKTLGPCRSVALALTSALPLGVLKGSTVMSVVAATGACIALVPLGIQMLRAVPRPQPGTVIASVFLLAAVTLIFYLLGEAG